MQVKQSDLILGSLPVSDPDAPVAPSLAAGSYDFSKLVEATMTFEGGAMLEVRMFDDAALSTLPSREFLEVPPGHILVDVVDDDGKEVGKAVLYNPDLADEQALPENETHDPALAPRSESVEGEDDALLLDKPLDSGVDGGGAVDDAAVVGAGAEDAPKAVDEDPAEQPIGEKAADVADVKAQTTKAVSK